MNKWNKIVLGIGIASILALLFLATPKTDAIDAREAFDMIVDDCKAEVLYQVVDEGNDVYNVFCGTTEEANSHEENIKANLNNNTLNEAEEYGYAQLFVRNDKDFANEIGAILAGKIDTKTFIFDGAQFDNDFMYQLRLFADVLNSEDAIVLENSMNGITGAFYQKYNQ